MMLAFLLGFSLFTARHSFAQNVSQRVDSLKHALHEHAQADTSRADLLVTLATAIVPRAPDEAKAYAEEALKISEQRGWQTGIARSLRMKGYACYITADYMNALDSFQKAAKAAEPLGDRRLEGTILNNMGLVCVELSEFDKALDSYGKFLAIARELKLTREEAIALMNTGLVYFKQNRPADALPYFARSLAIAEANGERQVVVYTLSNMGAAFNRNGQYREGLASFEKSVLLADQLGDTRIKVQSVGGIGESYFHLKKYNLAEQYSLQALHIAEAINLVEYQKEMYQGLSEIYEKQNNSRKALEAYKRFDLLRDSILSDQKKQELTRKQMQFEFEKKEAVLNAQHEAELARQSIVRNAAMGGGAALLLAAAFSFVFYKKRRDADEHRREAEFKAQVSDTEMKALRAQMNPHFIFNSLNSIGDYILKHDTRRADTYLTKFAKLMRLTLENSEKKEITLSDDLLALELYLQLESLRLNGKFTFEILVDDDIDRETTLIPPLLLQPFVENSIWHGIARKEGIGRIVIRIMKEGGMINCIVEDNGIGRKQAPAATPEGKARSLGIKITETRINILNKLKQSHARIEFSDLPEGTRVQVKLPLMLQF